MSYCVCVFLTQKQNEVLSPKCKFEYYCILEYQIKIIDD